MNGKIGGTSRRAIHLICHTSSFTILARVRLLHCMGGCPQVRSELEGGLASWKEKGHWEVLALPAQLTENPDLCFAY